MLKVNTWETVFLICRLFCLNKLNTIFRHTVLLSTKWRVTEAFHFKTWLVKSVLVILALSFVSLQQITSEQWQRDIKVYQSLSSISNPSSSRITGKISRGILGGGKMMGFIINSLLCTQKAQFCSGSRESFQPCKPENGYYHECTAESQPADRRWIINGLISKVTADQCLTLAPSSTLYTNSKCNEWLPTFRPTPNLRDVTVGMWLSLNVCWMLCRPIYKHWLGTHSKNYQTDSTELR